MKHKVGDIVTIRKDLVNDFNTKRWGYTVYYMEDKINFDDCCDEMVEQGGKQFVIRKVTPRGYWLEGIGYNWTDEMFEEE